MNKLFGYSNNNNQSDDSAESNELYKEDELDVDENKDTSDDSFIVDDDRDLDDFTDYRPGNEDDEDDDYDFLFGSPKEEKPEEKVKRRVKDLEKLLTSRAGAYEEFEGTEDEIRYTLEDLSYYYDHRIALESEILSLFSGLITKEHISHTNDHVNNQEDKDEDKETHNQQEPDVNKTKQENRKVNRLLKKLIKQTFRDRIPEGRFGKYSRSSQVQSTNTNNDTASGFEGHENMLVSIDPEALANLRDINTLLHRERRGDYEEMEGVSLYKYPRCASVYIFSQNFIPSFILPLCSILSRGSLNEETDLDSIVNELIYFFYQITQPPSENWYNYWVTAQNVYKIINIQMLHYIKDPSKETNKENFTKDEETNKNVMKELKYRTRVIDDYINGLRKMRSNLENSEIWSLIGEFRLKLEHFKHNGYITKEDLEELNELKEEQQKLSDERDNLIREQEAMEEDEEEEEGRLSRLRKDKNVLQENKRRIREIRNELYEVTSKINEANKKVETSKTKSEFHMQTVRFLISQVLTINSNMGMLYILNEFGLLTVIRQEILQLFNSVKKSIVPVTYVEEDNTDNLDKENQEKNFMGEHLIEEEKENYEYYPSYLTQVERNNVWQYMRIVYSIMSGIDISMLIDGSKSTSSSGSSTSRTDNSNVTSDTMYAGMDTHRTTSSINLNPGVSHNVNIIKNLNWNHMNGNLSNMNGNFGNGFNGNLNNSFNGNLNNGFNDFNNFSSSSSGLSSSFNRNQKNYMNRNSKTHEQLMVERERLERNYLIELYRMNPGLCNKYKNRLFTYDIRSANYTQKNSYHYIFKFLHPQNNSSFANYVHKDDKDREHLQNELNLLVGINSNFEHITLKSNLNKNVEDNESGKKQIDYELILLLLLCCYDINREVEEEYYEPYDRIVLFSIKSFVIKYYSMLYIYQNKKREINDTNKSTNGDSTSRTDNINLDKEIDLDRDNNQDNTDNLDKENDKENKEKENNTKNTDKEQNNNNKEIQENKQMEENKPKEERENDKIPKSFLFLAIKRYISDDNIFTKLLLGYLNQLIKKLNYQNNQIIVQLIQNTFIELSFIQSFHTNKNANKNKNNKNNGEGEDDNEYNQENDNTNNIDEDNQDEYEEDLEEKDKDSMEEEYINNICKELFIVYIQNNIRMMVYSILKNYKMSYTRIMFVSSLRLVLLLEQIMKKIGNIEFVPITGYISNEKLLGKDLEDEIWEDEEDEDEKDQWKQSTKKKVRVDLRNIFNSKNNNFVKNDIIRNGRIVHNALLLLTNRNKKGTEVLLSFLEKVPKALLYDIKYFLLIHSYLSTPRNNASFRNTSSIEGINGFSRVGSYNRMREEQGNVLRRQILGKEVKLFIEVVESFFDKWLLEDNKILLLELFYNKNISSTLGSSGRVNYNINTKYYIDPIESNDYMNCPIVQGVMEQEQEDIVDIMNNLSINKEEEKVERNTKIDDKLLLHYYYRFKYMNDDVTKYLSDLLNIPTKQIEKRLENLLNENNQNVSNQQKEKTKNKEKQIKDKNKMDGKDRRMTKEKSKSKLTKSLSRLYKEYKDDVVDVIKELHDNIAESAEMFRLVGSQVEVIEPIQLTQDVKNTQDYQVILEDLNVDSAKNELTDIKGLEAKLILLNQFIKNPAALLELADEEDEEEFLEFNRKQNEEEEDVDVYNVTSKDIIKVLIQIKSMYLSYINDEESFWLGTQIMEEGDRLSQMEIEKKRILEEEMKEFNELITICYDVIENSDKNYMRYYFNFRINLKRLIDENNNTNNINGDNQEKEKDGKDKVNEEENQQEKDTDNKDNKEKEKESKTKNKAELQLEELVRKREQLVKKLLRYCNISFEDNMLKSADSNISTEIIKNRLNIIKSLSQLSKEKLEDILNKQLLQDEQAKSLSQINNADNYLDEDMDDYDEFNEEKMYDYEEFEFKKSKVSSRRSGSSTSRSDNSNLEKEIDLDGEDNTNDINEDNQEDKENENSMDVDGGSTSRSTDSHGSKSKLKGLKKGGSGKKDSKGKEKRRLKKSKVNEDNYLDEYEEDLEEKDNQEINNTDKRNKENINKRKEKSRQMNGNYEEYRKLIGVRMVGEDERNGEYMKDLKSFKRIPDVIIEIHNKSLELAKKHKLTNNLTYNKLVQLTSTL